MNEFSGLRDKLSVETTGEFKNIELTDEQYERLLTLLKIGMKVSHSAKDNDFNIPLIDIDQYISSYAGQFNAGHLVERNDALGGVYFYTKLLQLKIELLQEKYLDYYLYDKLSIKLAERDLLNGKPDEADGTYELAFKKIKARYMKELTDNGVDRVVVDGIN